MGSLNVITWFTQFLYLAFYNKPKWHVISDLSTRDRFSAPFHTEGNAHGAFRYIAAWVIRQPADTLWLFITNIQCKI
jgi:hypothetical protein